MYIRIYVYTYTCICVPMYITKCLDQLPLAISPPLAFPEYLNPQTFALSPISFNPKNLRSPEYLKYSLSLILSLPST